MSAALPIALAVAADVAVGVSAPGQVGAAEAVLDGIQPVQDAPASQPSPRRMPQLNTLRDIWLALELCWEANEPPVARSRPGMTLTLMLTVNKKGELLGEPRFTFVTPEASQETRALYEQAVVAAINACTPLPISEAFGNAIAGRPHVMTFIDQRNQKGI